MNLPTSFTTTIRNTFGENGKRWLAELPDLLAEASHRWELTLGEPFLLSYNYVCAVTRADGTPAVLKLGVPNRELSSETAALRLYDGEGACRLYESDPEAGMLLFERLFPGTMLCDYADDETHCITSTFSPPRAAGWQLTPRVSSALPNTKWGRC
ncbi:MAG: aminoglycoside phosphotransferase family protein [Anaerolineales bacterium]|nr:aminoglycoside phosphotransferase family protein [Anaerolineales bacterium]